MHRNELIEFMLGTGEYETKKSATEAIQNKLVENLKAGMTKKTAWESTVEFMETTLETKAGLYRTREEAKNGCLRESEACIKFANRAIDLFRKGAFSDGYKSYDFAETASVCAMQAHEVLWRMTKGKMTDDEFAAFEQAEIACGKFHTCKIVLNEELKKVGV